MDPTQPKPQQLPPENPISTPVPTPPTPIIKVPGSVIPKPIPSPAPASIPAPTASRPTPADFPIPNPVSTSLPIPGQPYTRPSSFPNYPNRANTPASSTGVPVFAHGISNHHSRKWPVVIAIVLLVILCGFIYVTYATIISPSKAIPTALSGVDSMSRKHVGFLVTADSPDEQINGLSISATSDIDNKASGSMDVQSKIYLESKSISLSGELRLVNNVLYGQLTSIPDVVTKQLSGYLDQWYSISLDTIKNAGQLSQVSLDTSVSQGLISVSGLYKKLSADGVLTGASFVGFTNYGGKLARRYSVNIDKDALALFINKLVSEGDTSSDNIVNGGISSIRESLESVDFSPIIITVDLLSGSLMEIKTELATPVPATPYSQASDVTMRIIFTSSPMPVGMIISAPENAESLDSLLTAFTTRLVSTSTSPTMIKKTITK